MGFLTVLVYIVLSFSVGVLLITIPSGIINLEALTTSFSQNVLSSFVSNITLILIGLVVILLCIRYIQKSVSGSRRNKNITFESKEGKVNITLSAIEDLLKKMLENREEVSHTKIRVGLKKRIVEVQIKGYLNYEVNLVEFTKEIQEKVKEKLEVLLGEDKKVQVNLQIRKISVSSEKNDKPEPEAPFRHYD